MYWHFFRKHHYLTGELNITARCFICMWDNVVVGFESVIAMPGKLLHVFREHRLVVASDFQGLGIGKILSECIGELLLKEGKRFFSKTANIKLGFARNKSDKWRETSSNMKSRDHIPLFHNHASKEMSLETMAMRKTVQPPSPYKWELANRHTFSHEYVGTSESIRGVYQAGIIKGIQQKFVSTKKGLFKDK